MTDTDADTVTHEAQAADTALPSEQTEVDALAAEYAAAALGAVPPAPADPSFSRRGSLRPLSGRLFGKSYAECSLAECYRELERIRKPDAPAVRETPRGEWVAPAFTREGFEATVYATAEAGQMTHDHADAFLSRLRKALAERGPDPAAPPARSAEDAERARRLYRQETLLRARIPSRYWDLRIDKNPFVTEDGRPFVVADAFPGQPVGNRRGFAAARKLAASWHPGGAGLTLSGGASGIGKSLLALAVGVYVLSTVAVPDETRPGRQRAARVVYVKSRQILQMFQDSYGATWDTAPDVLSTEGVRQLVMVRPEMLILDDLGAELVKPGEAGEWARTMLLDLLDYRVEHGLTTLVTTNLDESGLYARYGRRTASRLLGRSPLVTMGGPDFRQGGRVEDDDNDPFA